MRACVCVCVWGCVCVCVAAAAARRVASTRAALFAWQPFARRNGGGGRARTDGLSRRVPLRRDAAAQARRWAWCRVGRRRQNRQGGRCLSSRSREPCAG